MSNIELERFDLNNYISQKSRNQLGFGHFRVNDVKQINMLLVGRSQTGKSTIIETLINPQLGVEPSCFSFTKEPLCRHLIVWNEENKDYFQLNVIDSPGLDEARQQEEIYRHNDELLNLIARCIEENIVALNVICFVSKADSMHHNDIKVFHEIEQFLGPEFSEITMMVLTHCDEYPLEDTTKFKDDIREHELNKPITSYCKLGIFTMGAVDRLKTAALNKELINNFVEGKLEHIENMRNEFLKAVFETHKTKKFVDKIEHIWILMTNKLKNQVR